MTTYPSVQPIQPGAVQPMIMTPLTPAPHVVVSTRPSQNTMKIGAMRRLSSIQIMNGLIAMACGIAVAAALYRNWVNSTGFAIWGGVWMVITGIIGLVSSAYPNSRSLVGTYMAFSIISTVLAFIDGIIFAVALGLYSNCNGSGHTNYNNYYYYRNNYYSYNNYYNDRYSYRYNTYDKVRCDVHKFAGIFLYGTLATCMVFEFFVALVASIYCCLACCSCCRSSQSGVVLNTEPQYVGSTQMTFQNQTYPTGVVQPVEYNLQLYPQQQTSTPPAYVPEQLAQVQVTSNPQADA